MNKSNPLTIISGIICVFTVALLAFSLFFIKDGVIFLPWERTWQISIEPTPQNTGNGNAATEPSEGYSLWAWGDNTSGQLGDGTNERTSTPVEILRDAVAISAGNSCGFAILRDKSLWAWGRHGFNLHGDIPENTTEPIKIMDGVDFVASNSNIHFAILDDGVLWVWGWLISYRMLINEEELNIVSTPIKIMDDVMTVSAGVDHAMAVTNDGSLWVWGRNEFGQLGVGTTDESRVPIKIMDDVIAASAGWRNSIAVKSDGSLWAWGSNEYGQLGDGTIIDRPFPVKIMDDVVRVKTEYGRSMAITNDNSLWGWGWLGFSNLDGGGWDYTLEPMKIMDDVLDVSMGEGQNLAIKTNGTLWAWGANISGSRGDDDGPMLRLVPLYVTDNVRAISAGRNHSLALIETGPEPVRWRGSELTSTIENRAQVANAPTPTPTPAAAESMPEPTPALEPEPMQQASNHWQLENGLINALEGEIFIVGPERLINVSNPDGGGAYEYYSQYYPNFRASTLNRENEGGSVEIISVLTAAADYPDIYITMPGDIPILAQYGIIHPINQELGHYPEYKDSLIQNALDINKIGDDIYGVSWMLLPRAFITNLDFLARVGIDPPDVNNFTVDDFIRVNQVMVNRGLVMSGVQGEQRTLMDMFLMAYNVNGSKFVDGVEFSAFAEDPNAILAVEALYNTYYAIDSQFTWTEMDNFGPWPSFFTMGHAGWVPWSLWGAPINRETEPNDIYFNWTAYPPPKGPGGHSSAGGDAIVMAVHPNAKNRELAFKYIMSATSQHYYDNAILENRTTSPWEYTPAGFRADTIMLPMGVPPVNVPPVVHPANQAGVDGFMLAAKAMQLSRYNVVGLMHNHVQALVFEQGMTIQDMLIEYDNERNAALN